MRNGASFDTLRSVKDPESHLRLVTAIEDKLRLVKDAASHLWVVKKKKKKKKPDEPYEDDEQEASRKKPDEDELEEFLELLTYVLCEIYGMGWEEAEEEVGAVYIGWNHDLESVDAEIGGKTFSDRVSEAETYEEVERIIDTEAHRNFNAGAYRAAKESGKDLNKTWRTMLDDKVRDSHLYLENVTVGLDDYFYTAGGAKALYPGQFGEPDEDVNCRCFVEYTEA